MENNSKNKNVLSDLKLDYRAFEYFKYWIIIIIFFSLIYFSYYILYYNYYKLDCSKLSIDKPSGYPLPLYNFI